MRKTYLYLAVCLGFILSCTSGGGDDEPPISVVNAAPSVPSQIFPLNNTLCIDNVVNFEWNASTDPESNSVTYAVELSENISFSTIAFSETSLINSKIIILPQDKAYYWRVKAIDSKQAESGFSSTSQFLTEGDGVSNHLPFSPDLVSPALDAEIDSTTTTLSWSTSDTDNDLLTYDVYLDTNSDPTTKVSENQTGTTYSASNMTAHSTYYFKVVVKDNNGATTIGQVWNFRTN